MERATLLRTRPRYSLCSCARATGTLLNLKCAPCLSLDYCERYDTVLPGWHMSKLHWISLSLTADQGNETALAILRSKGDNVEPEQEAAPPKVKDWSLHGRKQFLTGRADHAAKERALLEREDISAKAKKPLQAFLRMERIAAEYKAQGVDLGKITRRIDGKGVVIFTLPSSGSIQVKGFVLWCKRKAPICNTPYIFCLELLQAQRFPFIKTISAFQASLPSAQPPARCRRPGVYTQAIHEISPFRAPSRQHRQFRCRTCLCSNTSA